MKTSNVMVSNAPIISSALPAPDLVAAARIAPGLCQS
jgi:hypothetical protein